MARIIILGLGNTLNHDEGMGVHALQYVRDKIVLPAAIELVDGGTLGLNLLPLVEECSYLLLLDATNAGQEPGSLIELRRDQIPLYAGVKLSQHQVTFQEVLGLANMRGHFPENLHLIGIQPVDLSLGIGMSPLVTSQMPHIVERVRAQLQQWALL